MGEKEDNENDEGDEDTKDQAQQYVDNFSTKLYNEESDEEEHEPKLQIVISCAELAGIFDPLQRDEFQGGVQFPYVEVYADDEEIGETIVASGTADGKPTAESSMRPVWNQSFVFHPDGTRYYRFRVCIDHVVRQRTIFGEAGFAAADAWRTVGSQKGPVALNVQLLHKHAVSGILHLVLLRYNPKTDMKAAEAAKRAIDYYERQAGAVDAMWDNQEWMSFPPDVRTDWSILGWSRDSWSSGRQPPSESTSWADLTDDEKFAAMRLGYDLIQWDGVKQIESVAASLAAAQYYWYTWQPDDLIKLGACSSLHRAHPHMGRDPHRGNNPPPILDIFPEDPSHKHEQEVGWQVKDRGRYEEMQKDRKIEDEYEAEEEDDESHLYMLQDIIDHVTVGYSYDDVEPVVDDIVYLPVQRDKAPSYTSQFPTVPSYTSQLAAAFPTVPSYTSQFRANEVSPSPYKAPNIPSSFPTAPAHSSQFQANSFPFAQNGVIPASNIRNESSLQPSRFIENGIIPTTNQLFQPGAGAPPTWTAPNARPKPTFAPVPSTLQAGPSFTGPRPNVASSLTIPLQSSPRLVGTTPMSSSAPPKVLTAWSQVPQQTIDHSADSMLSSRYV